MTQTIEETEITAAMSEVMVMVLIAISRMSETMPDALELFDHTTQSARTVLKKEWDSLRTPEFSEEFEVGLARLAKTMRQIHDEVVTS